MYPTTSAVEAEGPWDAGTADTTRVEPNNVGARLAVLGIEHARLTGVIDDLAKRLHPALRPVDVPSDVFGTAKSPAALSPLSEAVDSQIAEVRFATHRLLSLLEQVDI